MNKEKKYFGDTITDEFKKEINNHLGDMDKQDLITYKMYVNRSNIKDGDKVKPNEFLGLWYAGMEVYADDGGFPNKDEFVVMSTNTGDNGYVVPYDYAVFHIGSEVDDSYRGMVLSINDVVGQISELKKYASQEFANIEAVKRKINALKVRKLHQVVITNGPNPSMTMQPIAEREK